MQYPTGQAPASREKHPETPAWQALATILHVVRGIPWPRSRQPGPDISKRSCRTFPAVLRRVVCALVALAPAPAHADGIAIVGGSPRSIGRAGAATVGDDGGGALLINPAALARRDLTRLQLGATTIEDELHWQSATDATPLSSGQAGSRLAPLGAAIGPCGSWIVGAAMMTSGVSARALARPGDARGDLGSTYDYRYAGIAGSYRRDTLALGAARRLGDSIAVGLSITASRVAVSEHRRIWAGFAGRAAIGDPRSDVDLELTASETVTPSAVVGLLYAPDDSRLELGGSLAWSPTVALEGTVTAVGSQPDGPSIEATGAPRATLEVRQPWTLRAGARYVGERVVAELDGDLWFASDAARSASWQLRGVRVVDPSQVATDLLRVPSRISYGSHVALRASLDVELIPGFLWATGGYALSTAATSASRQSPSFGDLGGHTLGLGIETTTGGVTVTLGWSRTWSLSSSATTDLALDNPFIGGDGPVPAGTYGGSIDQVGVLVELELGGATR